MINEKDMIYQFECLRQNESQSRQEGQENEDMELLSLEADEEYYGQLQFFQKIDEVENGWIMQTNQFVQDEDEVKYQLLLQFEIVQRKDKKGQRYQQKREQAHNLIEIKEENILIKNYRLKSDQKSQQRIEKGYQSIKFEEGQKGQISASKMKNSVEKEKYFTEKKIQQKRFSKNQILEQEEKIRPNQQKKHDDGMNSQGQTQNKNQQFLYLFLQILQKEQKEEVNQQKKKQLKERKYIEEQVGIEPQNSSSYQFQNYHYSFISSIDNDQPILKQISFSDEQSAQIFISDHQLFTSQQLYLDEQSQFLIDEIQQQNRQLNSQFSQQLSLWLIQINFYQYDQDDISLMVLNNSMQTRIG